MTIKSVVMAVSYEVPAPFCSVPGLPLSTVANTPLPAVSAQRPFAVKAWTNGNAPGAPRFQTFCFATFPVLPSLSCQTWGRIGDRVIPFGFPMCDYFDFHPDTRQKSKFSKSKMGASYFAGLAFGLIRGNKVSYKAASHEP